MKKLTIGKINGIIQANITLLHSLLAFDQEIEKLALISELIFEALTNGHTIFTCGNGGSMADALHFSAELVGRFQSERAALPSVTLGANPSILTAVANDYRFEEIFSREISGLGRTGDVLVLFSTSGTSPNIKKAVEAACLKNIKTIAFFGNKLVDYEESIDVVLHIPSDNTPHIQECHTLLFHIICQLIDERLETISQTL